LSRRPPQISLVLSAGQLYDPSQEQSQLNLLQPIASVLNANVDAMGHGAVLLAKLLISVQILVENVE
jgi:hypothetical protein